LSYVSAVTLTDGRIATIGGFNGTTSVASVRIGTYTNNDITWITCATSFPISVHSSAASVLNDGRIVVTGGTTNGVTALNTIYIGTVSGNDITWVASASILTGLRSNHRQVTLSDNRIFIAGGRTTANTQTAQISLTSFGTVLGTTVTFAAGTVMPITNSEFGLAVTNSDLLVFSGGYDTAGNCIKNVYTGKYVGNAITYTRNENLLHFLEGISININNTVIFGGGYSQDIVGGAASLMMLNASDNAVALAEQVPNSLVSYGARLVALPEVNRICIIGGIRAGVNINEVSLIDYVRNFVKSAAD
jgi:hypothetical protein